MDQRFLHADRHTIPASTFFGRTHRHPQAELVYVLERSYAARVGGRELRGPAGSAFVFPAGLEHRPLASGPRPARIILLQWQGGDRDLPLQSQDGDGRLLAAILWLWDLAHHQPPTPAPVLDGLLGAVLHQVRNNARVTTAEDALCERARAYLAQDLAYDLSLPELAATCGVSPATLARRFRGVWGQPPLRYRRRLRAERALALLREGSLPLRAVALAVGYSSPEHLSRVMRAELGRTPSSLRHPPNA